MNTRKKTSVKHSVTRLDWKAVRLIIMANTASGTITEFACDLGKSTQALRDAVRGKAPRVLARMEARLGNLSA